SARGLTTAEVLRREHRRQAADQVSIGNSVTSLRLLAALDWTAFFERHSTVEAALRTDPSGVYPRQDFATRDAYRRAVEQLARGCRRPEIDVARHALARAAEAPAVEDRRRPVGFYLVHDGPPPSHPHLASPPP